MASYLIGHITVKDPKFWNKYVNGVRESLLPYETEVIFRGKLAAVLDGGHEYQDSVVIKFVDQATLQERCDLITWRWYYSKKYQELIPTRDKAADVVLMSYDD